MSSTMPWQGYLLIGFVVLFVGGIALIFLFAFLEGWWLSRQSVPSRFQKLKTESDFDHFALPSVAQELGMKLTDSVPGRLSQKILEAMSGNWEGAEFLDVLVRKERDGVFLLCNVRRAQKVIVGDSSGEGQMRRYLEVDPVTVTAFLQNEESTLPDFSTRPFFDYLIVRLSKLFGRKWSGHPRFEDDPEFHEKLLISAAEPEKVRPVLTDRVRNVLKEYCELTMMIRDGAIVIYDDGHPTRHKLRKGPEEGEIVEDCKVLAADCWPQFFKATESMIQSLKSVKERSR